MTQKFAKAFRSHETSSLRCILVCSHFYPYKAAVKSIKPKVSCMYFVRIEDQQLKRQQVCILLGAESLKSQDTQSYLNHSTLNLSCFYLQSLSHEALSHSCHMMLKYSCFYILSLNHYLDSPETLIYLVLFLGMIFKRKDFFRGDLFKKDHGKIWFCYLGVSLRWPFASAFLERCYN